MVACFCVAYRESRIYFISELFFPSRHPTGHGWWACHYRDVCFPSAGSSSRVTGREHSHTHFLTWEFLHHVDIIIVDSWVHMWWDLVFAFFQKTFLSSLLHPDPQLLVIPLRLVSRSYFFSWKVQPFKTCSFLRLGSNVLSCLGLNTWSHLGVWTHLQAWVMRRKQLWKWTDFQGWGNSKHEGSATVTDTACGWWCRKIGGAAAEGAREGGGGRRHQRLPSSSKSKTQGMLYVRSLKKSVSVGWP